MAGNKPGRAPGAANEAARKEYEAAPIDKKPSARELARKHDVAESTIYRSAWFRAAQKEENK